jgi:hypothetical protein
MFTFSINNTMKYTDIKKIVIENEEDLGKEFLNLQVKNFDRFLFNPEGVDISDDQIVDLVKDAKVLKTDTWKNIIDWINENKGKLIGNFIVAKKGMVLHQFTISNE